MPFKTARRFYDTAVALSSHEHWFLVIMAGLTGVYAGIAAGLFANAIAFFQIVLFHTGAFVSAIAGDAAWRNELGAQLRAIDWNVPLFVVGASMVALSLFVDRAVTAGARLAARAGATEERVAGALAPHARRFRLLAALTAVGIALYYPLLGLRAVNQSFHLEDGLAAMLATTPWPVVLLVPALGGLLSGLVVRRFTPRHTGHGVSEVMAAVVRDGARIPPEVPIWKTVAAAITTASGGSVGREGPVVQLGSGVGSAIGQRLGFSRPNLTVLVGSGAAAGIAASFNAPIAGAMFALEIILGDFGIRTFSPIVIASVMGTVTSRALLGRGNEVERAHYAFVSGAEIAPYALLGITAAILSILYIRTMGKVEKTFHGGAGGFAGRWIRRLPAYARPALGGLLVGAIGLAAPRVLGTGYETMNAALRGDLPWTLLGAICLAKILATGLTLGSGAQGGSFFPAAFIGATGGGAFGALLHERFPTFVASSGAYALVGMGAVVAGATQAPLTGIVMLFELTNDYEIILPLMVACIISTTIVQLALGGSLYTLKLKEQGIELRGGRDLGVLRSLRVADAMQAKIETIGERAPFLEVMRLLGGSSQPGFPVIDGSGRLCGILSFTDVRAILGDAEALRDVVCAGDLASKRLVTVFSDEDLEIALERLEKRDVEVAPVVDRGDDRKLLGLLARRDVLAAYDRAVRHAALLAE